MDPSPNGRLLRLTLVHAVEKALSSDDPIGWRQTTAPCLADINILRTTPLLDSIPAGTKLLLSNDSSPTSLELADGQWKVALNRICHTQIRPIAELAQGFETHVLPAQRASSTRAKNWRYWSTVVTWAIAHGALASLMPMPQVVLMALTFEFLHLGCGPHLLHAVWSAIATRHHVHGLPSPLRDTLSLGRLMRTVGSLTGVPKQLKFPIQKSHIQAILLLPVASLGLLRDVLITALSTICCLRTAETIALQVCDVWFDLDAARDLIFLGTLALNVRKRKQDQIRRGHHPRCGRSIDPRLDIVHRLRRFLSLANLRILPGCTKRAMPAAICPVCPPLFPKTTRGGTQITTSPSPRDSVTKAIRRCLTAVQADTTHFSGISARKGGLTTAIEAKVPEYILFMQSGHGQKKAARAYMHLQSPEHLFDTWQAFGL